MSDIMVTNLNNRLIRIIIFCRRNSLIPQEHNSNPIMMCRQIHLGNILLSMKYLDCANTHEMHIRIIRNSSNVILMKSKCRFV